MDKPNTSEPATKVVKIHRFQIGLSVLIQIIVVAAIAGMVNYISLRHYRRWDFSRDHKYALSSQTANLLHSLKKPVRAVIFFSSASDIAPDVSALLREYEFSSKKMFTTEVVDPFRNFTRAQELQTKYKFGANENILILDYDGRNKFVNASEMADYEMPDQMSMMMGQAQPRVKAFKGEQAITSALLELTEGKPNKVYFVAGHGEPDLKSPDLQVFGEALKRQNIQIAPLTLQNVLNIPEDARAVILCGPTRDLSEVETKQLSVFWQKKGRIFVLLNPYARTPRLATWLSEQGVEPQQDRVVGKANFLAMDQNGNPQITQGIVKEAGFVVMDSGTKITKDLQGVAKRLFGTTQSLRIKKEQEVISKLKFIPLLQSAEGFWGETDLGGDETTWSPDKDDHPGPLALAVAVEKGGVSDERVKLDTSRLMVIGNAQFFTNNANRLSENVTNDLAVNALNWLLDREELIGIPPKEKSNVALSLDDRQVNHIAIAVMLLIPGIVAFFGLLNWWQRRN